MYDIIVLNTKQLRIYMHLCMCDYIYINEFTHTYFMYVYESSLPWYHEKVYLLILRDIFCIIPRPQLSCMLAVPTPLVSTVRISMYVYVLSTTYNHQLSLHSVEIESGGFSCDACRYGLVLRSHSMYVCVYVCIHA
jgi:hypothetical protein